MEIRSLFTREKMAGIDCGEGLTEQSHKKETDMNYILREYARTGFIKHSKENAGRYDDVTATDFTEAMNLVTEAQRMFNELPAQVRGRFANNPAEFLNFVQNPDNGEEMRKLGILKGNDGIDVSGTAVNVPTQAHFEEAMSAENPAPAAPKPTEGG